MYIHFLFTLFKYKIHAIVNKLASISLQHAISLSQQLQYYKEYQAKLAAVAGSKKAASILKEALYLASFGSSDFLQNYYINPLINKIYTPDQYASNLVLSYKSFIRVSAFISKSIF